MKSLQKIINLAQKIERKLSLGQMTTQQAMPAPDYFFGVGYNLQKFISSLGDITVDGNEVRGDKSLSKMMADFWNKTNQNASVTVKVEVVPGKGARWVTEITPPSFVAPAMAELNKQYQAVTGRTWAQGQSDADKAAKQAKSISGDFKALIVDKGI